MTRRMAGGATATQQVDEALGQVELVAEGNGLLGVPGFRATGVHAAIKRKRRDVCLIVCDTEATAAGMFTQNAFAAAPVHLTKRHIRGGTARAIICNSGNANACTGHQGNEDALEMAERTANHLGVAAEAVLVASTGIIGRPLDMEKVRTGIDGCIARLDTSEPGEAAEAITTTDTYSKEVLVRVRIGDRTFHIGGIAKGAGMIHPNMATMLSFMATDAPLDQPVLQATLKRAVDGTFNMITVDGDTSTNDMVLLLAGGAERGQQLAPDTPELVAFERGLTLACRKLARMITRDGEGATILLEVAVDGAETLADARLAARAVAASNLVKSAMHGRDPNWGRIVAAVGASGARVEPDLMSIRFVAGGDAVFVFEQGEPKGPDALGKAAQLLQGNEVRIEIDLGIGPDGAEAWGCDLTEAYVEFNSAYTT